MEILLLSVSMALSQGTGAVHSWNLASRARNDTAFIRLLYVGGVLVFYGRSDTVLEWCSHAASNNYLNHILV
jgi:hypothetical protein